jgi:hypothetical protein
MCLGALVGHARRTRPFGHCTHRESTLRLSMQCLRALAHDRAFAMRSRIVPSRFVPLHVLLLHSCLRRHIGGLAGAQTATRECLS